MERAEFLPSKEKTSMKELHIHVGFTRGRKFCCPEEEEISMTAYGYLRADMETYGILSVQDPYCATAPILFL